MPIKTCPECGKEVRENSKHCPNCGYELHQPVVIPEEPKNENVEVAKEEISVCKKCGTELKDDQQFCPKCGTERGSTNNKKCPNCGTIINPGEKFCSKCGTKAKIDLQSDIIDKTTQIKNAGKKKVGLIVAIIAIVLVVGFVAIKVFPNLTVSTEQLLAEGKYQEAFQKAGTEEAKKEVLLENIIAKFSYEIADGLKDPDSFKLSHVYYDGEDEIVFEVIGKNSYGGNVTNYYDYRFDEDDEEYGLYVYLSSLEDEETYSWDTSSEKLEKLLKNVVRSTITKLMSDKDSKVDDEVIDRVNNLFKENKLRDVELISQISMFYPEKDNDAV